MQYIFFEVVLSQIARCYFVPNASVNALLPTYALIIWVWCRRTVFGTLLVFYVWCVCLIGLSSGALRSFRRVYEEKRDAWCYRSFLLNSLQKMYFKSDSRFHFRFLLVDCFLLFSNLGSRLLFFKACVNAPPMAQQNEHSIWLMLRSYFSLRNLF